MTSFVEAPSDDRNKAVHALLEAFEAAWNRHDAAAMAAFLTEDAEWVNVVGWWWRGKSRVQQGWDWIHRVLFKNTEWHADSVATRFPTSDTAIISITGTTGPYMLPDGTAVPIKRDRISIFMVKHVEGWLIAAGQNSEINPEAEHLNPVKAE